MIKVKLNDMLKDKDITLYRLAQLTGLSYQALHSLSNSKTQSIRFDTLEKICIALDVDIGDILEIVLEK